MLSGSISVSYGAKSVGVSGTGGTTVIYYLYLDDPDYTGTGTLVATTNGNNVYGNDGRVYIGDCSVTFPTVGSGGGGGRDSCVCLDQWLALDMQAGDAVSGLMLDCIDMPTRGMEKFRGAICSVEFTEAECVEIETTFGAIWRGSESTPFDLPGGGSSVAFDMLGRDVVTDLGTEQGDARDVHRHAARRVHPRRRHFVRGRRQAEAPHLLAQREQALTMYTKPDQAQFAGNIAPGNSSFNSTPARYIAVRAVTSVEPNTGNTVVDAYAVAVNADGTTWRDAVGDMARTTYDFCADAATVEAIGGIEVFRRKMLLTVLGENAEWVNALTRTCSTTRPSAPRWRPRRTPASSKHRRRAELSAQLDAPRDHRQVRRPRRQPGAGATCCSSRRP